MPAVAPAQASDTAPLDAPIEEEFRVGTMALAWDSDDEGVVIEAQAQSPRTRTTTSRPLITDEDEDGPPLLRVRLAGLGRPGLRQAGAGGRRRRSPPCPFCGGPLDPGVTSARAPTATAGEPRRLPDWGR